MIVRVWGVVNRTEVEFTPVSDRPSYWEGYAPRAKDFYQNLEIWAKNDLGAIGYLKCSIVIKEWSPTTVQLLLAPYAVEVIENILISKGGNEYDRELEYATR